MFCDIETLAVYFFERKDNLSYWLFLIYIFLRATACNASCILVELSQLTR